VQVDGEEPGRAGNVEEGVLLRGTAVPGVPGGAWVGR